MKYKFIEDLTSDVMFESYGFKLEELFENSAEALFSIMCEIDQIEPKEKLVFEFESETLEDALFNFLSTLLAESEIAELFLCKFKVKINEVKGGFTGKVTAYGESFTKEKGGTLVKGITNYKFKIGLENEKYTATVVCDI